MEPIRSRTPSSPPRIGSYFRALEIGLSRGDREGDHGVREQLRGALQVGGAPCDGEVEAGLPSGEISECPPPVDGLQVLAVLGIGRIVGGEPSLDEPLGADGEVLGEERGLSSSLSKENE